MQAGALSGLKVVEYSQFIAGPFCGKFLADFGAEVIKVEEPGVGDEARRRGPFPDDIPHQEKSGLFLFLNTNKLGITLNVKSATGTEIFKELVQQADILVESNPPQLMKALGLDYETLSKINPRLIMTSITPFGQTGPYRDYKSCDLVCSHMSQIAICQPFESRSTRREPLKSGGHQTDFMAGLTGAVGTMSALLAHEADGLGQQVDVSAQEATAISCKLLLPIWTYLGWYRVRIPKGTIGYGPSFPLPCKDGYFQLYCLEEGQWWDWVRVMGSPDWANDPRFDCIFNRGVNWDDLEPLILEYTMQHTKEELYRRGQASRVPVHPVNTTEDVLKSEQFAAREFFVEIDHPEAGRLKYPGPPFKSSKTPWQVERPAPLLGEHNEEIFCKRLGYSKQKLVKLRQTGII